MGGFVGLLGVPRPRVARCLARMLDGNRDVRRPPSVGRVWPLATLGSRDVDFAEDETRAIAVAGYVRDGGRTLSARELLERHRHDRRAGAGFIETLGGEFAIALHEGDRVTIARDRLGTRPLYYAPLDGGIAFGTAIGPLWDGGVAAASDEEAILRSLVLGYVPPPRTAFVGVAQVLPGEIRTLGVGASSKRYYVPRERRVRRASLPARARELDAVVGESVVDALGGANRAGAFLSGGVDSSLVLARLHALGVAVTAFTLHFGDDLPGEIRYARGVAEHLGVRHHVLECSDRDFCDALDGALLHLEDLLSEPIAVPNFLLAGRAAREVEILFTGEGGDPPFGGPKNIGLVLAESYRERPLAPSLPSAYLAAHHHLFDDLDAALTDEARARFDAPALADALAPHFDARAGAPGATFVGRLMAANTLLKGGGNILVKVARMVGAHDLALRSPLFDPRVVDLALAIPPDQKLAGTDEKVVLRDVARRYLPSWIVDRPKRGMGVPLAAWMRGRLGELAADVLTERAVRERGLVRWPFVRGLLDGARRPTDLARSRTAEKVWLLLVAELHQRMVEARARRRPAREATRAS